MTRTSKSERASISLRIDGKLVKADVPPRLLLSDFLRNECGAKGVHVGCEHGVCGACTILVDGRAVRSCLMFAVQAEDTEVKTVASMGEYDSLSPLQENFRTHHALQCGFCTPGILISAQALLDENPTATRREVEELLAGHLCRCTGYTSIVDAIMATETTS